MTLGVAVTPGRLHGDPTATATGLHRRYLNGDATTLSAGGGIGLVRVRSLRECVAIQKFGPLFSGAKCERGRPAPLFTVCPGRYLGLGERAAI